jgi:3-oxoacyl-[acyl-carrier-protein] synthase II
MLAAVAITGTGIISPLGNRASTVWRNWLNKYNPIEVLSEAWSTTLKTKLVSRCKHVPIELEPHELSRLDRCTQLAIAAAQQAWDECGKPEIDPQRIGVVMSSGIGGLETLYNGTVELEQKSILRINPNTLPMAMPNSAAGLISIMLNASGDISAPNSACAGGAEAIAIAAQWVNEGHVDIAIAGGCEALINKLGVCAFEALGALSPDSTHQPQPFGLNRNGFVLGEGAGTLVLENGQHALDRGARILGWVLGWGSSADAYNLVASRPDGLNAKRAIENAIKKADVRLEDIALIKAHATGTKTGDLAEARVLGEVWGNGSSKPTVIAPKSEIGHCISASGPIELIMALSCLQQGVAPGLSRHYELDPMLKLPFAAKSTEIIGKIGLCNSFGFGGKNQALIIKSG